MTTTKKNQSKKKVKVSNFRKVYEVFSDHELRSRFFASKASALKYANQCWDKYHAVYMEYQVSVHELKVKP